jgi:hypothetical protein
MLFKYRGSFYRSGLHSVAYHCNALSAIALTYRGSAYLIQGSKRKR